MADDNSGKKIMAPISLGASILAIVLAGFTLHRTIDTYVELQSKIKDLDVYAQQAELQRRLFNLARDEGALWHRKNEQKELELSAKEQKLKLREEQIRRIEETLARKVEALSMSSTGQTSNRGTERVIQKDILTKLKKDATFLPVTPGESVTEERRKSAQILIEEPRNYDKYLGKQISVTGWMKHVSEDAAVALLVKQVDESDDQWIVGEIPDVKQNGLWFGTLKKLPSTKQGLLIRAVLMRDPTKYRIGKPHKLEKDAPSHEVRIIPLE